MKKEILFFALVFFLAIPITTAIGVSVSYYKDNPLILKPSESQIVNFTVKAPVEQSDIIITANVIDSPENFAEVVGKTEFTIPQGSSSVKVPVKIKIPKNANPGDQIVSVKFTQLSAEQGMVQFSPAMTVSFPLKVLKSPSEKTILRERLSKNVLIVLILAGIASLVLGIAITLLAIRIKREKQSFRPFPKYHSL